jgi:hypothetical protein
MATAAGRRETKGTQTLAGRARSALNDGDYALARSLAKQVAENPAAEQSEKDEALEVMGATKVDRGPIVAGFVILTILITLFTWVLTQKHTS